jgi:stress-induced-phosphoprotein 1
MKEFDQCIEACQKAIERGRELFADYKLVARAMTRKVRHVAPLIWSPLSSASTGKRDE